VADLYLDDCADDDMLIASLRHAGHFVESPRSAGTRGWDDPDHWAYAAQRGYTLITKNPDDFVDLHSDWPNQGRTHGGILLIYTANGHRLSF